MLKARSKNGFLTVIASFRHVLCAPPGDQMGDLNTGFAVAFIRQKRLNLPCREFFLKNPVNGLCRSAVIRKL